MTQDKKISSYNSLNDVINFLQGKNILKVETEEGKVLPVEEQSLLPYLETGGSVHASYVIGDKYVWSIDVQKNMLGKRRPIFAKFFGAGTYSVSHRFTGIELTNEPISKEWEQELSDIAKEIGEDCQINGGQNGNKINKL